MRYILFLLLLCLIISCSNKKDSIEYWIRPESQNDDLSGFMVTKDYCELLEQKSNEWELLSNLYDSLVKGMNSIRTEELDSSKSEIINANLLTVATISEFDSFMHSMVENAGGYCSPKLISLPTLPYRKKDMEEFWNNYSNQKKYKSIIGTYNSEMYSILPPMLSDALYNGEDEDIDNFKRMNNVEALINIIQIELRIVNLNAKAKSIILQSRSKRKLIL